MNNLAGANENFSFLKNDKLYANVVWLNTLGEKLKCLREIANFSQEQLAKALGIGLRTFGKYERNEISPTVCEVEQIAKICQMHVLYFSFPFPPKEFLRFFKVLQIANDIHTFPEYIQPYIIHAIKGSLSYHLDKDNTDKSGLTFPTPSWA